MIARTMTTPLAIQPMLAHMCPRSICIARPPGLVLRNPRRARTLRELEVHGHGHDDRYRHAVQKRRRVDPLLDGFDRRLVEERDAPQHLDVGDLALRADRGLEDDDTL